MKRYITLIIFLIIGTLLFQGFQCASPEMTTARLKFNNKLYDDAEDALARELSKKPNNGEALYLMAETKVKLKKYAEAADYAVKASKAKLDPKYKMMLSFVKFNIWVATYNKGITLYNEYTSDQKRETMQKSIDNFDIAIKVRPKMVEFQRIKGNAYETLGEIEKALDCYKIYEELLQKEIEYAKNAKIHLFLNRDAVFKKIGKPKDTNGGNRGTDSTLTDTYSVLGNRIYIYYAEDKDSKKFIVEGWRVSPPADWTPNELANFTMIDYGPFGSIASSYYEKAMELTSNQQLDSAQKAIGIEENLNTAKKYIKLITTIDPTNVDANRFLISIYDIQGKSDEALEEVKKLVQTEPNNKFYLAQYGEILFRLDKYDEAIEQYEKALKVDPEYSDVLRNIAATYKNMAAKIQREQQDKHDQDKTYQENPDEYKPFLKKAATYFAKCRSSEKYKNDLLVLSELADLYIILKKQDELNSIVDALERMQQIIPDEQKSDYWFKMCKIYGDMKSPKQADACKEAGKYLN